LWVSQRDLRRRDHGDAKQDEEFSVLALSYETVMMPDARYEVASGIDSSVTHRGGVPKQATRPSRRVVRR
jgi:hypothetical protein